MPHAPCWEWSQSSVCLSCAHAQSKAWTSPGKCSQRARRDSCPPGTVCPTARPSCSKAQASTSYKLGEPLLPRSPRARVSTEQEQLPYKRERLPEKERNEEPGKIIQSVSRCPGKEIVFPSRETPACSKGGSMQQKPARSPPPTQDSFPP